MARPQGEVGDSQFMKGERVMKKLMVVCAVLMFVFVSVPEAKAEMGMSKCVDVLKKAGASKNLINKVCISDVIKFLKTRTIVMELCGIVRDDLAKKGQLTDANMRGVGCSPAHLSDGQIGRHGRNYGN